VHAAEAWPSRPVRLIVPYPPGASTDTVAREVVNRLSQDLGQQFIVENRPGAGGQTGSATVARSDPDGYTLLLGTNGSHGLGQLVNETSLYDAIDDFTPLTPVAIMPVALAAHPSVPADDPKALVDWIKQQPGQVSYATAGVGSPHHIAGELLNKYVDGKLNHVPYKGTGQSMTDLLGGHIPLAFSSLSTVLPYAADGRLKIIGLIEDERQKAAPKIPTIGEELQGYRVPGTWLGFFGPAGMSPDLTKTVNQAFVNAITSPEVSQRIDGAGLQAISSTPEEFEQRMKSDIEAFKKIIADAGITAK